MGNGVSTLGPQPVSSTQQQSSANTASNNQNRSDSILGELGNEVLYDKSLGTTRFLKTIRARHKQGPLVVKVYLKPDTSWSLKPYQRRVKLEREQLQDCPNVLPYQRAPETERACYLIRQWVASNLYDRISTRPFLSLVEKRWVAFQLLTGLRHARERNISHGDIKTENIVVTSWNWVYLTDFASFKPTYLPLDDPSTFSFFFDSSSRRTCYLAPERFYAPGSEIAKRKERLEFGKRDGKVTEAMDVFGLGCVLAELWMEGTPPFTLSQLFKYREGEYNPEPYLAEIEDVEIRSLIRSMISLDPSHRLTCDQYLTQYRGSAFPTIFYDFLHPFISSLNESTSSATSTSGAGTPPTLGLGLPSTLAAGAGGATPKGTTVVADQNAGGRSGSILRTAADEIVESLVQEWDTVVRFLDADSKGKNGEEKDDKATLEREVKGTEDRTTAMFPVQLCIPGVESSIAQEGATEDGPALILLSLLCANLRNCLRPASVIRAFDLLLALSKYLTDETKLDRLVPYLVAMLEDDSTPVRAAVLRTLTQTLILVKTITPSNAAMFTEYIFPNTKPMASDPELLPRITYAECIAPLAEAATRFLEMKEAMKTEGTFKPSGNLLEFDGGADEAENYDSSLLELQSQVQEHINPLLSDPSPVVKRALLLDVGRLCLFFGRPKANDAVLAHLVTYLNTRDWMLRAAWNEHVVEVARCVGPRSLEEYILPLITLSLSDSEEFVVVQVLSTLTTLTEQRLLAKGKIWELVAQITGFLCHPNLWIREGAAAFLTSTARGLQPTDRWCILYPTIKRLLRSDLKDINEKSIMDIVREPVSRVVFEAAVAWAGKSPKSHFWAPIRAPARGAPREASVQTDDDLAQLEKLRGLGMKPEDEYKLSTMRDHIIKLAQARQGSASRYLDSSDPLSQAGGVGFQELGIVPQTIILRVRTADEIDGAVAGSRVTSDNLPRRFSIEPARTPASVTGSNRNVSGQPMEDLRRRLAQVGGSNTSLNTQALHGPASPAPDSPGGGSTTSVSKKTTQDGLGLERTISHSSSTEDISDAGGSSRTDFVAAKSRSRVHLNAVEVGRVAPAVGQDSTNVMGLFNVASRYKVDDDAMSGTNPQSHIPFTKMTPNVPSTSAVASRFVSTYEGNDPRIKQLVERGYLDNYREPLPELGPFIPVGIPRARALRSTFPARERKPTRPEGTLVAHLVEHTAAITDIQVAPDQLFFVTGSEDGTVKVWDTIRLEKNVTSKSRHTYQQGGKITSICILENSHCIASASDNGTLWIHRVDVNLSGSMPKYSKAHLIRQRNAEEPGDFVTCMSSFNTQTTTNLVLGTSLSKIVVLDIRTMRSLQEFENPRQYGPITCLTIDKKRAWMVAGTSSGTLTLWDLRFGILLRHWSVGQRRIFQVTVHPSKGKGRWIIVAIEDSSDSTDSIPLGGFLAAEVWDVDEGVKVEEFRVVPSGKGSTSSARAMDALVKVNGSVSMKEATLDPAAAIEALLASSTLPVQPRQKLAIPSLNEAPDPDAPARLNPPGVRTFLAGIDYAMVHDSRNAPTTGATGRSGKEGDSKRDAGFLLTGGEDRKVRFWDLEEVEKSVIVSGLDLEDERPLFSVNINNSRPTIFLETPQTPPSTKSRSHKSSTIHRSSFVAGSQTQILCGHQEALTALAVIDLPFRCIVSGDRAGVVKCFY
ncbi:Other/VPS15 protein kinase [Meredithblackwellia eburnea MCA 4105]